LPGIDFLPAVVFLGVNLSTFSTVLEAVDLEADFLVSLDAALTARLAAAPPLTLAAPDKGAYAFLALVRATTAVLPSLKCQSSDLPCTILPSPAEALAREATTPACLMA
jgi:hypothetical protein